MKTNTSLLGGFGLALVGTTCCALPILLVAMGMGIAASMVAAMPWLAALSKYKAITFSITAIILAYAFFRLRNVAYCELADQRRLKWQRALLWSSTGILVVSVFTAYALLPLTLWREGTL